MTPYNQFFTGHDGDALEVTNYSSGNRSPAEWFLEWATGGHTSDAGVNVNGYTALTHCPLWQGVNIIAGDIGQVPIRLVRNEFNDQTKHNAWQLLRVRPNKLQTPSLWKETMMQWALIWGNGVAWTPRIGSRITDLIPLRPDCLWPELVAFDDGQILLYHYLSPTQGREYIFFPDEVIHIQGLTSDGVWGYALHEIAKNCIGQGLALEKHGNLQFSNGARPSGVLEHPARLDQAARANLRREWESIHGGADNAGKIAILWEGMKFNATQMSNVDSQWIEAKKLNRVDCASLLNLPAHKLNALEDSSVRSNLEEQNETYKQMTLTRWANRMDEEFRRKLLTDAEWKSDEFRFVFDWDAFLTADLDTLTQVADRLVMATILNPNEARRMLGYAPRKGGEVYGSPAINPNPKRPEDGKESPDNGRPPGSKTENAHREALSALLAQSLKMESKLLRQAAEGKLPGDSKNFVEWLDEFYQGNGTPSKFMGVVDSIMGKSLKAAESSGVMVENVAPLVHSWAIERRRAILEACSNVTTADLPSMVSQFQISSLTDKADQILRAAFGADGG